MGPTVLTLPGEPLTHADASRFHVRGRTVADWRRQGTDLRRMVPTLAAHQVDTHQHAQAHFVLVLRGRYCTRAARPTSSVLGSPLLVFNPPRTEHRDCFAAEQALPDAEFLSLTVSDAAWWALGQAMALPLQPEAAPGGGVAALGADWLVRLERRQAFAGSASPEDGDDVDELLTQAASPFVREHAARLAAAPAWLSRVRQRLRERVWDDAGSASVRLFDLAAEHGVHPVYLARAFRMHMRQSPSAYLRGLRLDKAASLLSQGRMPLAEVAQACGFFDQAHLAHAFRRAYGQSPSAFRAR